MLFRKKVIEAVAEVLEGVVIASSSVFVFGAGSKKKSGELPLVQLLLAEPRGKSPTVQINSALGIVELSAVEEVHISEATREAAFIAKAGAGKITIVTVSSTGVLQVYSNISRSIASREFAKITSEELRAAIALKVFTEGGKKFE